MRDGVIRFVKEAQLPLQDLRAVGGAVRFLHVTPSDNAKHLPIDVALRLVLGQCVHGRSGCDDAQIATRGD